MNAETIRRLPELNSLSDRWLEVFGYDLPLGFGGPGAKEIPMLRRCLESRDDTEYRDWLPSSLDDLPPGALI